MRPNGSAEIVRVTDKFVRRRRCGTPGTCGKAKDQPRREHRHPRAAKPEDNSDRTQQSQQRKINQHDQNRLVDEAREQYPQPQADRGCSQR